MIRNRLHITLSTEGEGRGLQMICLIEKVIIPKGGGERFDDNVILCLEGTTERRRAVKMSKTLLRNDM